MHHSYIHMYVYIIIDVRVYAAARLNGSGGGAMRYVLLQVQK